MLKKIAVWFVLAAILSTVLPLTAMARDYGAELAALDQKYGMNFVITDTARFVQENGKEITSKANLDMDKVLDILKKSFAVFPPGLIKEVTEYFSMRVSAQRTRPHIEIYPAPDNNSEYTRARAVDGDGVGTYIYIPLQYFAGKEEEIQRVIVHELSHLVWYYMDRTAFRAWTPLDGTNQFKVLNNGKGYSSSSAWDGTFVSQYATKSFEEDFAETVAYLYTYPDIMAGKANDPASPIAMKKALIEEWLITWTECVNAGTDIWLRYENSPDSRNVLKRTDVTVTYNNRTVPYPDTQPLFVDGVVYVPLYETVEFMGGKITNWHAASQTATAVLHGSEAVFQVGNEGVRVTSAGVDRSARFGGTPARLFRGSVMVPVSSVGVFGARYTVDRNARIVDIVK